MVELLEFYLYLGGSRHSNLFWGFFFSVLPSTW